MKLLLYVTRKCLWKGYTVCGKHHDFVVATIDACSEKYECLVQNTLDSLPDALVLESVLQCTEAEAGLVAKLSCLCTCTQEPKTISNGGYPTKIVRCSSQ